MAPLFIFFVSWKLIPESPRWLVCKSRTKEAAAILNKIATTNGADAPDDLEARLEIVAKRKGSTTIYGFLSLFSSPVLLLRTAMLSVGLTASLSTFYQIFDIISTMTYNMHLNYLILAIISLPGRALGEKMLDDINNTRSVFFCNCPGQLKCKRVTWTNICNSCDVYISPFHHFPHCRCDTCSSSWTTMVPQWSSHFHCCALLHPNACSSQALEPWSPYRASTLFPREDQH